MIKNKDDPYSDLPKESFEKYQNFCKSFDKYFKNQIDACDILKISQPNISRILSGKLLVTYDIARRFEKHTKGDVKADDICFDVKGYEYDFKKSLEKLKKTA